MKTLRSQIIRLAAAHDADLLAGDDVLSLCDELHARATDPLHRFRFLIAALAGLAHHPRHRHLHPADVVHGTADQVVPFDSLAASEEGLKAAGIRIE